MGRDATQPGEEVSLHIATLSASLQTEGFVDRLLSVLRDFAPEYLPESFQAVVAQRHEASKDHATALREDTIPLLLEALQKPGLGRVNLTKGSPPELTVSLPSPFRTGIQHHYVHLSIRRDLIQSRSGRRKFLQVAQRLFLICDGVFADFGTFRHPIKQPLKGVPGVRRLVVTNLKSGLPPPDWGFLLGPDYVALLGRDRIERAPFEVVREFGDHSFLLLLAEDFETLDANEALLEERRQRLVGHFGPEYFSYVPSGGLKIVLPQLSKPTMAYDSVE